MGFHLVKMMKYIYFSEQKTAILQEKIHKIVLDGNFVNFHFDHDCIIVELTPDPESFFERDEEVDDDIVQDWFFKFCGLLIEPLEDEMIACVYEISDLAISELKQEMTKWKKYKAKSCSLPNR